MTNTADEYADAAKKLSAAFDRLNDATRARAEANRRFIASLNRIERLRAQRIIYTLAFIRSGGARSLN